MYFWVLFSADFSFFTALTDVFPFPVLDISANSSLCYAFPYGIYALLFRPNIEDMCANTVLQTLQIATCIGIDC